jgi:hypothetical protein
MKQELWVFFLGCMHCIFLTNAEWFLLSNHIPTYVKDFTSPLNCSARDQFNFLINVYFMQVFTIINSICTGQ